MLALAQMMPACHKFASFTESLGGRRLMREKIAMIFLCAGVIGSFVLAGYWAYWIWQFDWGHSSRGRGLWFMAMIFGSIYGGLFCNLPCECCDQWRYVSRVTGSAAFSLVNAELEGLGRAVALE